MRIQVTRITGNENAPIVHFSCGYGSASGVWMEQDPPEIKEYLVEFDMKETYVFGENVAISANHGYAIFSDIQNYVHLRGRLEVFPEDDFRLRIGNAETLLDIIGELPPHNTWVEFKTDELRIYNTHVL